MDAVLSFVEYIVDLAERDPTLALLAVALACLGVLGWAFLRAYADRSVVADRLDKSTKMQSTLAGDVKGLVARVGVLEKMVVAMASRRNGG